MLNYQSTEFKSLEELRVTTPSIFTRIGSVETSEKYTHIPTDKVISDMELLGWGVADAQEVKARTEGTIGFQKHLVVFRNPDVVINGSDGDMVFPQILLTNSHDGKNSFKFTVGLFRMICANGLVITTETFEDIKVRHMGYDFETLQNTLKEMISKLPLTVEAMNKMKEIQLETEQMFDLAKSFLDLRIEGTGNIYDNNAVVEVLKTQRVEDEGSGLWEVFNRVQENIMEGNFKYLTVKGKMRQARVIKNFKQDQDLNKKLFSKALEFIS
tara:strand:- start:5046 stop:5855 length:810 start_codon:yes stop_codon:yes gene_type:complete